MESQILESLLIEFLKCNSYRVMVYRDHAIEFINAKTSGVIVLNDLLWTYVQQIKDQLEKMNKDFDYIPMKIYLPSINQYENNVNKLIKTIGSNF